MRPAGGVDPRRFGGCILPEELTDLCGPVGEDARCEEEETALSFCCETGRYGCRHSVIASR